MSGWTISTHNMPWIKSHAEAEEYFKSRSPWPQHSNWRPLDNKRTVHKRLVLNEVTQTYQCVLYEHALVTYHPNGKVALECYNSVSSCAFAHRVSPEGMSVISHRNYMYWKVGDQYFRTDRRMTFQKEDNGWVYLDGAATDTKLVVDRKKAADVRKILKPLLDWLTVHERITGQKVYDRTNYSYTDAAMNEYLNNPSSDLFIDVITHVGGRDKIIESAYKLRDAIKTEQVPLGTLPPRKR